MHPHGPTEKAQYLYLPGAYFLATRHEPHEPLPLKDRDTDYLTPETQPRAPHSMSQTDLCLSEPRVLGTVHEDDTRSIKTSRPVRIGDTCGAQILLTDDGLIAKIYDPI